MTDPKSSRRLEECIAVCGGHSSVSFVSTVDGTPISELAIAHGSSTCDAKLLNDTCLCVTGWGGTNHVALYDLEKLWGRTGASPPRLMTLKGHTGNIWRSCVVDPAAAFENYILTGRDDLPKMLATGGQDGNVILWDLRKKKKAKVVHDQVGGHVYFVERAANGIVAAGDKGFCGIFDPETLKQQVPQTESRGGSAFGAGYSPHLEAVFVPTGSSINVWDVRTLSVVGKVGKVGSTSMHLLRDRMQLAVTSGAYSADGYGLYLYDIRKIGSEGGEPMLKFIPDSREGVASELGGKPAGKSGVLNIVWHVNRCGRDRIVTGQQSGNVRQFSLRTGKQIWNRRVAKFSFVYGVTCLDRHVEIDLWGEKTDDMEQERLAFLMQRGEGTETVEVEGEGGGRPLVKCWRGLLVVGVASSSSSSGSPGSLGGPGRRVGLASLGGSTKKGVSKTKSKCVVS